MSNCYETISDNGNTNLSIQKCGKLSENVFVLKHSSQFFLAAKLQNQVPNFILRVSELLEGGKV